MDENQHLAEKEQKNTEENKQKEKNKGKKKDRILYWCLAFVIAVIILFFAANKFYSRQPSYPTITYNNWEFTQITGMWWFEWQKGGNLYSVLLRFNPYETENVPIIGKLNTTAFNSGKYVYITFDLSDESSQNLTALALAAAELTQNIATAINRTPMAACVNNLNYACEERLIKTCDNTDEPVIYLKEGGNPRIILDGSCIILEGEDFELLRAVDRLLYHWYKIM